MAEGASFDSEQGALLEAYYARYCQDPQSVPAGWRAFFSSLASDKAVSSTVPAAVSSTQASDYRARAYIEAVRARGHYLADLDPLSHRQRHVGEALEPAFYGLDVGDAKQLYDVGGFFGKAQLNAPDLVSLVEQAYGGTLALDYTHIDDGEQRAWLQGCVERAPSEDALSREEVLLVLEKLTEGELFEHFLQRNYPGSKRFSSGGC